MEILFTGLHSIKTENRTLKGQTSIWMFPIYGMACLLKPVCRMLSHKNILIRGSVYTGIIFLAEYTSGTFLKKYKACPWDYSNAPMNIRGVIRLDYAPLWFGAGLLFEKILCRR